jgi:chemotaxis protein CheZ
MIVETEDEKKKYLNGPALEGDVGHISQNDIDALFN